MIVPMLRVLVAGPKPLMAAVIETIQRQGRVHIAAARGQEQGVCAGGLAEAEAGRRQSVERAASEIDGLLALLGFRGRPARQTGEPDWGALEAGLRERQERVRALVRRRLELEDELALIASYQQAFEALSPLLSRLEGSARLRAFGFIIKGTDATAAEPLRRELGRATSGRCEVFAQALGDGRVAVLAAHHAGDTDRVRGFFAKLGVSELKLPSTVTGLPMAEAVRQLKGKLRDLPGQIRAAQEDIGSLAGQWGPELAGLRLLAGDVLARLAVRAQVGESRFTFLLQGYLPQDDLPGLRDALRAAYQDRVTVQTIEIGHRDAAQVPVMLKNNRLVKPFEMMLSIFNPPRYGTVDPTPFIAFFFPLYFGFIVGDLGYGLVMLALALALRWKLGQRPLVRPLTTIFALCAAWTAAFGVVYGELFGDLGEHMHWLHPMADAVNRMRPESLMPLFWSSIAVGAFQVMAGFGIMLYQGLRHRDRHHILEPLAFVIGIAGVAGFAASWMFGVIPSSFMAPSLALLVAGAGLLGWLAGVAGPIEIFGAVGNILSFARLFAIGLSAAYLAYAANLIGRTIGGIPGILVAALVVHPLFFALGLISPIMQSFRLQVVEFFTKFKYHDYPGKQYKPFKTTGETP